MGDYNMDIDEEFIDVQIIGKEIFVFGEVSLKNVELSTPAGDLVTCDFTGHSLRLRNSGVYILRIKNSFFRKEFSVE